MKKRCPYCKSYHTKKNGKRSGKQRYYCKDCNHVFENKRRIKATRQRKLWKAYVRAKQTYSELAEKYKVSKRTIQRRIDHVNVERQIHEPYETVIIMDTCYFGRNLGVMVFRDHYQKVNIYWKFVKYETISDYVSGINHIREKGWKIVGIVCDGKRGTFSAFGGIAVQMCQYHQVAIVTRYITKKPRLEAGIKLKELTLLLTRTDKESFTGALEQWYTKWKNFLSEKTINPETKRWHYTHKRIRSAYRSLKHNLPYLFTWYDNIELKMPNTTNSLEGVFSNLKTKLRVHSGLKQRRKIKLINAILNQ